MCEATTWSLEIKVRIGHIELLYAEGDNFLFHFLGVIGLEFQVDCLQKVALIQSVALVDKAKVEIIQLKAVHVIGLYSDFAAQDIAIEFTNPVLF
jgi:hypothetical protein